MIIDRIKKLLKKENNYFLINGLQNIENKFNYFFLIKVIKEDNNEMFLFKRKGVNEESYQESKSKIFHRSHKIKKIKTFKELIKIVRMCKKENTKSLYFKENTLIT